MDVNPPDTDPGAGYFGPVTATVEDGVIKVGGWDGVVIVGGMDTLYRYDYYHGTLDEGVFTSSNGIEIDVEELIESMRISDSELQLLVEASPHNNAEATIQHRSDRMEEFVFMLRDRLEAKTKYL